MRLLKNYWPRRRSGSSIRVVDADDVKRGPLGDHVLGEEGGGEGEEYKMMMMMAAAVDGGQGGPHRELPVDVPDSFIARSKTPPRYPPPRPHARQASQTPSNGTVVKPVPPPRTDTISPKDGVTPPRGPRAPVPPPQLPSRAPLNNNIEQSTREPTKEQLDSIRKFQEQIRKRKAEEERVAQQNEFLNRSLRGSKKLQALESSTAPQAASMPPPSGLVNDAYADDEEQLGEDDTLHKVIGYGELVASLQRLQLQLKKSGVTEGQVTAVQSLLLRPEFARALATHNRVQESWPPPPPHPAATASTSTSTPPLSAHSQTLVRECLESIQTCALPEASELADLLTQYELEGLLFAHDAIARDVSPERMLNMVSPSPQHHRRTPTPPAHERQLVPRHSAAPSEADDSNIKIIKIEKTNEPLGATVRNEGEAVMIGRVVRGGAAEKSGLLHEGDEVLEVNGLEMRGKTVNEVCDLLSTMTGTLTFLIVPAAQTRSPYTRNPRDTLMHVKAHFDYDPEDDIYIPCRELGISFQKGDVLHVICQDDPNWWQAFREGEEDQTLAGLIPSRSFQHQRESFKQSITGDKINREKSKKSGSGAFLCAKKNTKKKKKKSAYNSAYNDGGYPIYSSNTADEYEVDEILTYEEVALYYPRANHKRPIVLIGPPNIGRHELRQRLMEDSERFAAAIPHTSRAKKDGEVDGQDYHFITRAQFEADILSRKFVEHGEYERAYYGTSIDAIRSVVNAGKICVLNLHPQSLKILRSSDLKPYVVFVAPPSLEKLRQKRIRNGEAYKEEELKDIIEKAREMEEKYGHFFDMIIINNDTERAYHQLLGEINSLEREPQWVPATWVRAV
ncbi:MAGUK p55 subfamily member 5 isoform X2 [Nilaparvata lugens]|uniref:MAGUK p55 subfamily member 5 isoform X2 n=1 Tax=Nilaparvata lugens TaxID=108931 RepID=UPI00193DD5F4|nr:MAGUK p55 subfamily member 5 isoform X2 [Nilaparvata lugens]